MLSIGSFSLVTGLSIVALRHYDATDVLPPSEVDPRTGYRRYSTDQIPMGRTIAVLRGLEVGIDELRRLPRDGPDAVLRDHRQRIQERADRTADVLAKIDRYLERGLPVRTNRISQVTIVVKDLDESVAFYRDAFDADYHEEISSFQFGSFPDDDFFLLTVANPRRHPWPGGPVKFGLSVDDVDGAHGRALSAGATEVEAPQDQPWKPRSSTVADPAGNHIDLYAAG